MNVGLSLMLEPDWLTAALPLFEGGEVDALEWSFDTGWGRRLPEWATALLDAYAGRLYGHGVTLSVLSAEWTPRQEAWLDRLRSERPYGHVSEHVGWSTVGDLVDGAPLPVPLTPEVVAVGRDRVRRLADAAGVPVGLENLALALTPREVDEEGDLLEALLAPVDGFVLLDLHNLWCRAVNFGRDPVALLERLPTHRVRELHVSGGSWHDGFRRDTHDAAVPAEVLALVPEALARCPVEVVILERLGGTLADPATLAADFRALRAAVGGKSA